MVDDERLIHLADARECFEKADKVGAVEDAIALMLEGFEHLVVYLEDGLN